MASNISVSVTVKGKTQKYSGAELDKLFRDSPTELKLVKEEAVRLPKVTFGINYEFSVIVSSEKPKSTHEFASRYQFATVDKDGWIVGQRSPEEKAA